jgi:hypothetical protein
LCVFEIGVAADFDPHGGGKNLDAGRILAIEQEGQRGGGIGLAHEGFAD